MRALRLVFGLVCTLSAAAAAVAEPFPYDAYVKADDVYVRSGPGRDYYPTAKMPKGQRVQVYRHDPGGWYAIRPSDDSFSWVSARYVQANEDGMGEVIGDRVVARVGSKFSNVRDVIQVRLDKGEPVQILGEHNAGGQTWYKIAAPAGEFRWVSGRYLDRHPVQDGISQPRRGGDELANEDPTLEGDQQSGPADDRGELVSYDGVSKPHRRKTSSAEDGTGVARRKRSSDRSTTRAGNSNSPPLVVGRHNRGRSSGGGKDLVKSLEAELSDIDAELARMVAEEPTVWTFDDLKERLDALLDQTENAVERGRVLKLRTRITRLEDIRRRHDEVNSLLATTDRENASLGGDREQQLRIEERLAAQQPAAAGTNLARFDGQGILRPVVSRRPNAPRYALVDPSGIVRSFITPAPGLNLQPYVGGQIGVTGTRGFLTDLRKEHVMVQRVTPLRTVR